MEIGKKEKLCLMKAFSMVAVIIMIGTSISGCFGSEDKKEGEIGRDETFILDTIGTVRSLDPAKAYDTASGLIIQNVYDRLLTYEGENTKNVVPMLLENMPTFNQGGLKYSFKLKEGIKFSNGNPLTAEDVKYSFDRVIRMNQGPSWILSQVMDVGSTVVTSEYTFEITLKYEYAGFLQCLAFHVASIVDKETVEAHGGVVDGQENSWMNENMVGTGPYILDDFNREQQRIVLVKNEKYWGNEPKIKKVIVKKIDELSTRIMELKKGKVEGGCDMAYIPTTDIDLVKNEEGITIEAHDSFSIMHIGMYTKAPPFDNRSVRQAFSYAFNYKNFIDNIIHGYGKQGQGPIPIGMFGHDNNLFQYHYDIEKAKERMEEGGYPNGEGFPKITAYYNTGNKVREQMLLMFQDNLKEIGVTLEIQALEWPQLLEILDKGKARSIFAIGWAPDYNDPDDYVYPLCHSNCSGPGGNHVFFENKTVDMLIDKAKRIINPDEREKLYFEIQKIIVEEAPYIWVYQAKSVNVRRDYVQGYVYNPVMLIRFHELYFA